MRTNWIAIGALWGLAAVALGAFGAHALEERASAEELDWWRTAAHYHLVHAVVLVAFGVLRRSAPGAALPGWTLLLGSALFSGTLYAMALGAPRWLGAITPVGGVALLFGWLALAVSAVRSSEPPRSA